MTSVQLARTRVVALTVPTATEPPRATESTVRAPVDTGNLEAGVAGSAGSVTATVTVTPSASAAGRGRGRVVVLAVMLVSCAYGAW